MASRHYDAPRHHDAHSKAMVTRTATIKGNASYLDAHVFQTALSAVKWDFDTLPDN